MWQQVSLKERLHYIDALRAFLMSYGIILHANTFMQNDISSFIGESSHIFRMQTFFVVSGFLTAMIFTKAFTVERLRNRILSLLVPFTVFAVLFNPIANYALFHMSGVEIGFWDSIRYVDAEAVDSPLGITWHLHLWFLPVLAFFTCIYAGVAWLLKHRVTLKILQIVIDPERRKPLSFLLLACIISLASVGLRGLYFVSVEEHFKGHPLNHILVSTLQFLPFFAAGCGLFFYKPLFDLFHGLYPVQWIVSLASVLAVYHFTDRIEESFGNVGLELALRITGAFCSVYSANLLLKLFSVIFVNPGKWVKLQSDAAYSVYLFHLYILIGLYAAFYTPGESNPFLYIGAVVFTYSLCLALHHGVIARFSVTRMLINGKFGKSATQ